MRFISHRLWGKERNLKETHIPPVSANMVPALFLSSFWQHNLRLTADTTLKPFPRHTRPITLELLPLHSVAQSNLWCNHWFTAWFPVTGYCVFHILPSVFRSWRGGGRWKMPTSLLWLNSRKSHTMGVQTMRQDKKNTWNESKQDVYPMNRICWHCLIVFMGYDECFSQTWPSEKWKRGRKTKKQPTTLQ